MTAPLISIIGPPAVGKTTLAEALAAELQASYTSVQAVVARRTWRHVPEMRRTDDSVADFSAWWERRMQQALMSERGHLIRSRAVMLKAWEAARA